MIHIPPSAQGVIKALEQLGYSVAVRQNRNGSNRYSVSGARETDALTMINRFDAGKYPSAPQYVDIGTVTEYGLTQKLSNSIRCF